MKVRRSHSSSPHSDGQGCQGRAMAAQTYPGIAIIVVCVAGIGALPYGFRRLTGGDVEKVGGWDRWDFAMRERDAKVALERKVAIEEAAKAKAFAAQASEADALQAEIRKLAGGNGAHGAAAADDDHAHHHS